MNPLALYLLKTILASGLFVLYYFAFLRNRGFHRFNRFFLLSSVILSLLLPLLSFHWETGAADRPAMIRLLTVVESARNYAEEIGGQVDEESVTTPFWIFAYLSVSVVMTVLLLLSLVRMRRLLRLQPVRKVAGARVVMGDGVAGTPFSFFRSIVWNPQIDPDSQLGQQVLQHELAHVRLGHSHDKLFLELTLAACWCNPFFWLIRRELRLVHEFQADRAAVRDGDAAGLAALMLQTAFAGRALSLSNPFFQSPLKRRMLMMTRTASSRNKTGRFFGLLLLAGAALAFTVRPATTGILPLDKEIVVVIDAGHGGKDHGAQGGALKEKDLTLKLARYVQELNQDKKLRIVLTRESDALPELADRVNTARTQKADLFISLHVNAQAPAAGEKGSGIEIVIPRDTAAFGPQSRLLGSVLQEELSSVYAVDPQLRQVKTNVFVLNRNVCPSVLIECGYITDAKDRSFIRAEANQKALARKILAAVARYADAR